jgi:hypothetical protein
MISCKSLWRVTDNGLQNFFNKRLAQAKQVIAEPAVHKLKLKVTGAAEPTPKITLRLGQRASPVPSPAAAPGLNAPISSPNGTVSRRNPFAGTQTFSTAVTNLGQLDMARSLSGSVASPTPSMSAVVKKEDGAKPSPSIPPPAANYNQGGQNGLSGTINSNTRPMLPPNGTGSNYGQYYGAAGQAQPYGQQAQQAPNPAFESKWRAPGKGRILLLSDPFYILTRLDASDAMITNLNIATHPGLHLSRHFRMDLPPSSTMAQQSITMNLPSSHYYLQLKPSIAPALLDRQHKLFVTCGTIRLHAMPASPGQPIDQRNPLFEARLIPGVNRIEVELIAALPKGKSVNGQDFELEKITVFANLLKP